MRIFNTHPHRPEPSGSALNPALSVRMNRTLSTPLGSESSRVVTVSQPLEGIAVSYSPAEQLETLYDEHAAGLHRWVQGMLGRREDADDAIQAIWLKLADRPEQLHHLDNPTAYLWTMARNHVRSLLRRRYLERLWTEPRQDDDEDWLTTEDGSISAEEKQDLAKAVTRLTPRLKAVVLLVAFEGHTLEEAALRLSIPRGTAASRYHAAIQKLHRYLGESQ